MAKVGICAIIHNEADYLLEWIAYHRLIGISFFLLYDNDSTDETADLLAPFEVAGFVKRISWPRSLYNDNPQVLAYRHAIAGPGQSCEWLAIIDADEFIVVPSGETVPKTIDRHFSAYDAVICSWQMFGSNGLTEAGTGLCIERFTRRGNSRFGAAQNFKTIVRPEAVRTAFIHNMELYPARLTMRADAVSPHDCHDSVAKEAIWGLIHINHYYCKSHCEWMKKRAKGFAERPTNGELRPLEAFLIHDQNDVEDLTAYRMAGLVKEEIRNLSLMNDTQVTTLSPPR